MKLKKVKQHGTFTVPAIFKEVKQTVSVFLNDEGVRIMKDTPYVRGNAYLACSRIIDDTGPNYLVAQVRYYKNDSTMPKYAYVALPHAFVKYMVSETPFFEHNPCREGGKGKRN